ncbi:hypothetical protein K1T71_011776 [Dendrolimus kikuchii]|uniref:Uncharacterized protein n=1 Tax=Dendrolimus kikuchii TaxID=765133 RepID=A0ACC1CM31_9NEOP|nr:hypothetical protein K1T71_011776 [Dendrolimus kikuchii]
MGKGQELLDAAREGDRHTVEKILGQITKRSGPFTSLRRGAGVNVQDINGYTPLHHACLNGHKDIVRQLLSVEASPCIVDAKGATPLHLAAFNGHSEIVRLLLAHNNPPVDINKQTKDQETALLFAAQFDHVDVVAQLMARGADVKLKNIRNEGPLELAAQYGRLKTVKHLLRFSSALIDQYRAPDCYGKTFTPTPLHLASRNNHVMVVEILLEAGVYPNIKTSEGTALHEAARYGRDSVAKVLLQRGADPNIRNNMNKSVYDLLADHSRATGQVRSVIQEYENHKHGVNYESDEYLPPFPVTDYSPTAPTAPETQKITNQHNSLISPSSSSLTKINPQSFVKKLASKCLGLKAKFNSAPNISSANGSSLEREVDVKSKRLESKNSNNTLLIGNSKFFKRLSKKEESGEINCNDEFDTISLDRLGTLNRDSVVNRSNRSCPGFKTSLPNISENNELSDSRESVAESVIITEIDTSPKANELIEAINYGANADIFEPRDRLSLSSAVSIESQNLINECYEPYDLCLAKFKKSTIIPKPPPRSTVIAAKNDVANTIYENVIIENKSVPKPAARIHIPNKARDHELKNNTLYENITEVLENIKPETPKRTILPLNNKTDNNTDKDSSRSVSRSSTLSSDSMIDETNLEDILLSEKSKSFRRSKILTLNSNSLKSEACRSQSNMSEASDVTEVSAIENIDCSGDIEDNHRYVSITGTLPHKKQENYDKKKVLFRHKTFTNIEADRNSIKVKDLPQWDTDFLKETLAHYHIRGTGHCIYKAPTVKEFINIFNRDEFWTNSLGLGELKNKRDSVYETAICFCKPKSLKSYNSAEDLLEISPQEKLEIVSIDMDALKNRSEMISTSFRCFCDSGKCAFHSIRRETQSDFVVKFSAIKKSISTPDITLQISPSSTAKKKNYLPKNKSVPKNLEEPYAVISVDDILSRNKSIIANENSSPDYMPMSQFSSLSSTSRPYSIKDITEVISLNSTSTSTSLSAASDTVHMPIRKSSSSEHSGHWSLHSCNSNVTIQSDISFKTCMEQSSDEDSDGTLHSDDESSDADTIKSDVSVTKRPWVHSDSFRYGRNSKSGVDVIAEESQSSIEDENKFETLSAKFESGISVEGSESSSSGCDEDSGVPRASADVSLDCASLERVSGMVERVCSGSGRRRWDELEGTSEGDALSISSAASSCAPMHLAHHHEYSKVSGAKNYLKHGRSVDHYVESKLSYSEYEENHNSPRVVPIPYPRPSLKQRSQPVAITAMYENVVIKEQNPRRKLRRNSNFIPGQENYEARMNDNRVRKYSNQEKSSLESLLDDQSMNSPSDCERFNEGHRIGVPLSPTHYTQPPTPDHPPPSAKQAENSIHERIRPLSQEYKRRSVLRDSQTETEVSLLRAASAASVASGATDRSGNTDNCVEEYVCDVPFAGLFKGSTTTLDGIGLRPMPAERPKTLRKLKSVYDASPTESPVNNTANLSSNGQAHERNVNGVEEEVRRRSNTTCSNQSAEKSLSILSPFDEQEEWAKISEIMASFGSKLVRESVFVSELEQEFTSRLGLSCSESSLSPSVASNLGLWLAGIGLHDYETLFLESGYDDIEFVVIEAQFELGGIVADNTKFNYLIGHLDEKFAEIIEDIVINPPPLGQRYEKLKEVLIKRVSLSEESRVRQLLNNEELGDQKPSHFLRRLRSLAGSNKSDDSILRQLWLSRLPQQKNNIQQLKEEIKEKLPPSENLKPVPPPVVPTLVPPGGETLKRSKKNRPAPQPPRPSDLEIRAPSELLVGVPGALKTQWKHQPFVLVTGAVTYVANYLGSTVVKELRGTESTKKSIQKLKKTTKEPRDSPDIILSISYRGVKFLNTITRELVCEHEIRNIHCACQDADDLTHFAYITKDHSTRSHYCHVFRVATMDQATEVILTLGEAFEVAYQMALREQSNRTRVTQSLAKTPTHDPMTTSNKEKPNVNHGRSHSITEIKLNGHQLKIAPLPASLSNEDFQATRNSDGSRSPKTPLLKAPIASTEEL